MNVSLSSELQRLVDEKVRSGLYNNASEVIRDGLRLLKQRDDLNRARIDAIRHDLASGVNALDSGKYLEGDLQTLSSEIKRRARGRHLRKKSFDA